MTALWFADRSYAFVGHDMSVIMVVVTIHHGSESPRSTRDTTRHRQGSAVVIRVRARGAFLGIRGLVSRLALQNTEPETSQAFSSMPMGRNYVLDPPNPTA